MDITGLIILLVVLTLYVGFGVFFFFKAAGTDIKNNWRVGLAVGITYPALLVGSFVLWLIENLKL
jgi:hypothetical protein